MDRKFSEIAGNEHWTRCTRETFPSKQFLRCSQMFSDVLVFKSLIQKRLGMVIRKTTDMCRPIIKSHNHVPMFVF